MSKKINILLILILFIGFSSFVNAIGTFSGSGADTDENE